MPAKLWSKHTVGWGRADCHKQPKIILPPAPLSNAHVRIKNSEEWQSAKMF
jgi:hypothetical protein